MVSWFLFIAATWKRCCFMANSFSCMPSSSEFSRIFTPTTISSPLCISNQAYRDMALAAYKEEDNTLCIGYAAGSMTGGGWEMLQTHIKSYGGDVMLEGTFVLLPYIKKAALFFLLIVILFALFFSQGDLLILTECLILFMFPLYLLYRNISKIGKCEEGRRLVLLYLEKVLHANVEISVEEE